MKLDWLADEFHDAGLAVIEHDGWKTRTMRRFSDYTPVGLVNHHTAGSSVLTNYPNPPYYSNTSLESKCNYTIRGDGTVVVLNAGWAHDSGYGDRKVLAAVQADVPAPPPTDTYNAAGNPAGANPGLLMNRWYIDVEVQHLGNGSPIAPVQREALITSNVVVCGHMGWNPQTRLIGHRESTTRKIDPRWGGFSNPMPKIRTDTLEADMPLTPEDIAAVAQATRAEIMGHPMSEASGSPTFWLAVDRINRNAHELVAAHRTNTLGVTDVDEEQIAQTILEAFGDEGARAIADKLTAILED